MTAAVFLDRDGVLNAPEVRAGKPYPPSSVEAMVVLPGAVDATRALKAAGFRLVVVTNQPDVRTGRQPVAVMDGIHARLRALMPLDDIRVCLHVDEDRCHCRKPLPGMLLEAARCDGIDLEASYMVGDRWRDIEAGRAAGCRTILVGPGYEEQAAEGYDAAAPTLLEASRWILQQAAGGVHGTA